MLIDLPSAKAELILQKFLVKKSEQTWNLRNVEKVDTPAICSAIDSPLHVDD